MTNDKYILELTNNEKQAILCGIGSYMQILKSVGALTPDYENELITLHARIRDAKITEYNGQKLFSVTCRWHVKNAKKDLVKTSIILASSEDQAKSIFTATETIPENAHIQVLQWDNGIFTMSTRKAL